MSNSIGEMLFAEGSFVQGIITKKVYVILRHAEVEITHEPVYVYIGKKGDVRALSKKDMEDGRFIEYHYPKGVVGQIEMTKHHNLTMPLWARNILHDPRNII